jgi:hypothetical protein
MRLARLGAPDGPPIARRPGHATPARSSWARREKSRCVRRHPTPRRRCLTSRPASGACGGDRVAADLGRSARDVLVSHLAAAGRLVGEQPHAPVRSVGLSGVLFPQPLCCAAPGRMQISASLRRGAAARGRRGLRALRGQLEAFVSAEVSDSRSADPNTAGRSIGLSAFFCLFGVHWRRALIMRRPIMSLIDVATQMISVAKTYV